MKVNAPDYPLRTQLLENAQTSDSIDARLNKTDEADEINPAMKLYYLDYMQKIMMSDGSDPDNQPDW